MFFSLGSFFPLVNFFFPLRTRWMSALNEGPSRVQMSELVTRESKLLVNPSHRYGGNMAMYCAFDLLRAAAALLLLLAFHPNRG